MQKKKDKMCLLAANMLTGTLRGCGKSGSSASGKEKLTFWFPTFAAADGEVTDEEFWNEKMVVLMKNQVKLLLKV